MGTTPVAMTDVGHTEIQPMVAIGFARALGFAFGIIAFMGWSVRSRLRGTWCFFVFSLKRRNEETNNMGAFVRQHTRQSSGVPLWQLVTSQRAAPVATTAFRAPNRHNWSDMFHSRARVAHPEGLKARRSLRQQWYQYGLRKRVLVMLGCLFATRSASKRAEAWGRQGDPTMVVWETCRNGVQPKGTFSASHDTGVIPSRRGQQVTIPTFNHHFLEPGQRPWSGAAWDTLAATNGSPKLTVPQTMPGQCCGNIRQ